MTYKKIAELAGVSLSTVSKALSGSSEISAETSKRILKLAEENGVIRPKYRRSRSKLRVAVIVPEVISVYYSTIVTAVVSELCRRSIEPSIHITGFNSRRFQEIIDQLTEDNIADGVVLLSSYRYDGYPKLPMVTVGDSRSSVRCDSVCYDLLGGIDAAVGYLRSLGHTKIGFMSEKLTDGKLGYFRLAMKRSSLEPDPAYIFVSDKRFEMAGIEAAEHYLRLEDRPTALIAAYDEIALGAIYTLSSNGVRIPDDISVIGINDIPSAACSTVPLTTLRTHSGRMVSIVIRLLLDRIAEPENERIHFVQLKCELIKRSSTAWVKPSDYKNEVDN